MPYSQPKVILLALMFYTLLLFSYVVASAEVPESEAIGRDIAPESIDEQVKQSKEERIEAANEPEKLNPFHAWSLRVAKEIEDSLGIALTTSYTVLYQAASDSLEQKEDDAAVGDLDIKGLWRFGGKHGGFVGFDFEGRHRITDVPPAGLGNEIGSLWPTAGGFSKQQFSLVQLWLHQPLFKGRAAIRVGKLDQGDYFDVYSFKSANVAFLNAVFSDNPVIPLPENGLGGAVAAWYPTINTYLMLGIADVNARKTSLDFGTFFNQQEYFWAAELGLKKSLKDLGKGYYQLMIWNSDSSAIKEQKAGKGFAVTIEQAFGDIVPFIRYSKSTGGATATRELSSAGAVFSAPLGREDDKFGIAIARGKPEDRSLRDQYQGEIYYSWLLDRYIHITPDLQLIVDPSHNPDKDLIVVFGIRARFTF